MITDALIDANPVSPSQVETYNLCHRKWGLNKLDGIPAPSNQYADRGTKCHSHLEGWMLDATPIDINTPEGKMVMPGLKFLPPPRTMRVEHNFRFRTARVLFHGKMDLCTPRGSSVVEVWDHKTTSAFKWMKKPEKLRRDPQGVIYAKAAWDETESMGIEVERLEQNWVYYLANEDKPSAQQVKLHVLHPGAKVPACPKSIRKDNFGSMFLPELLEHFAVIEDTATEMLGWRAQGAVGKDLPYDATACYAFGGCPYKGSVCKLTFGERIGSMEAQKSLGEKMKQAREQSAAAAAEKKESAPSIPKGLKLAPSVTAQKEAGEIVEGAKAEAAPAEQPDSKAPDSKAKVNPPEESLGTDPDAYAAKTADGSPAPAAALRPSDRRTEIAATIATGVVASRIYGHDTSRYAANVAKAAIDIADELIKGLNK